MTADEYEVYLRVRKSVLTYCGDSCTTLEYGQAPLSYILMECIMLDEEHLNTTF